MKGLSPLYEFSTAFAALADTRPNETELLGHGAQLLKHLIQTSDWLPAECRAYGDAPYRQYLLHCDPAERFSVVSFVWAPGQGTPIHDHGVWGLVGILEGAELSQRYELADAGLIATGEVEHLPAGEVTAVSPAIGDIHQVTNALQDRPSISIHVYGANIGRLPRRTYATDGTSRSFISGYANAHLPAPWNALAGL